MMVHVVKISWDDSLPLTVEKIKIEQNNFGDAVPSHLRPIAEEYNAVLVQTTLIRISHSSAKAIAGMYAYSFSSISQSAPSYPNIRATRLAMACGLHSQRFTGDVYVGRRDYVNTKLMNVDLSLSHVQHVCECSPDMRVSTLLALNVDGNVEFPEWLENATQMNYHDNASLSALANAMKRAEVYDDYEESDDETATKSSSSESDDDVITLSSVGCNHTTPMLTNVTLCWHCRGPASTLCKECGAVYFCGSSRRCQVNGWSHLCLCRTWKLYVDHRDQLSSFPYFSGWQKPLLQKDCFTSEYIYSNYLKELGVISSRDDTPKNTWWTTELHGWAGGGSTSAKEVNIFHRVSYTDGFALEKELIPQERQITTDNAEIKFDEHGLPVLNSWQDWYQLRCISLSSPVALLATFPLTLYYSIQRYGSVPLTVAKMMERPLRVHVVGIEKELNFVDLFREVGYLLPSKSAIHLDMHWIVREDMFPQNSKGEKNLSLQLSTNVRLTVVCGTYGDNLDPDFDFNGAPDIIVGMNAGLYAYDSWRYVIDYLYNHPNVVGVFTDYNEHSGLNCSSLGGSKSRKSLRMNPFRQPRAMPVYCMNLPQFSNGFIYVFNEQELE